MSLIKVLQNRDVKFLCQKLFPNVVAAQNITPNQEKIVRAIAFSEHPRLLINAMTRYGKSQCVAFGVAQSLLFNKGQKTALIAPTRDQTEILRGYIGEVIASCELLSNLVELERGNDIQRLRREVSRKRLTFKNGCEIRTLSAHGEAEGLMGFGADRVIKDDAGLISRAANAKIMRMLGDNPNAQLIELANPWNRDSAYYDHWVSGRYKCIQIGYKIALKEGRITPTFIEEMREELTPPEFTVLYESDFPDEGEDSLFRLSWVKVAERNQFESKGKKIIACDVAGKGMDRTVIMWGYTDGQQYKVEKIYSEAISDPTKISDKIEDWYNEFGADMIHIDPIGEGSGVVSTMRSRLPNVTVRACHFGETPEQISPQLDKLPTSSKKRFVNKKGEQYFRLREIMREGLIDIPEEKRLQSDLLKMKFVKTLGTEKIKIVDPDDKSPDFSDCLVYFIWKSTTDVGWFFG